MIVRHSQNLRPPERPKTAFALAFEKAQRKRDEARQPEPQES